MPPVLSSDSIMLNAREYEPGDTVSGAIIAKIDKECHVRSIKIRFKGRAETGWDRIEKIGYWPYFEETVTVWKAPAITTLTKPGIYRYPFQFVLPTTIPPTFYARFGNIRYTVKVEVDRPNTIDLFQKKEFYVVKKKLDEEQVMEMESEPTEEFNFVQKIDGLFMKGEVFYKAHFTDNFFVPDKPVYMASTLQNFTNRKLKKVSMKIYRRVEYFSTSSTLRKTDVNLISESDKFDVNLPSCLQVLATNVIKVPAGTVPTFTSEIINLDYFLQVKVYPSGLCAEPIKFLIDIKVVNKEEESAGGPGLFDGLITGIFRGSIAGPFEGPVGRIYFSPSGFSPIALPIGIEHRGIIGIPYDGPRALEDFQEDLDDDHEDQLHEDQPKESPPPYEQCQTAPPTYQQATTPDLIDLSDN